MKALLPSERVERTILLIRGHKVMLDTDLAHLYGVTTKRLNERVKRNRNRLHRNPAASASRPEGSPSVLVSLVYLVYLICLVSLVRFPIWPTRQTEQARQTNPRLARCALTSPQSRGDFS